MQIELMRSTAREVGRAAETLEYTRWHGHGPRRRGGARGERHDAAGGRSLVDLSRSAARGDFSVCEAARGSPRAQQLTCERRSTPGVSWRDSSLRPVEHATALHARCDRSGHYAATSVSPSKF
jgi:hypothetical protein